MDPVEDVDEPHTLDRLQLQSISRGKSGQKDINKQSKIIIGDVYKCFKNLANNPETSANINFGQVRKFTAKARGMCESQCRV
jgi:hypothetical protein